MVRIVLSFAIKLAVLSSLGCSLLKKVKVEDHEWCQDLATYGAECFHIVSDKERTLDAQEWYEARAGERFGQVCGSIDAYSNFKTIIEQLCYTTKACDVETKKKIDNLFTKIKNGTKKLRR